MNLRRDAFRYGLLIGLRDSGCTEKLAYGLLDALEDTKYDLKRFQAARQEKIAGFAGLAKGLLGGAKGFAKGLTGLGAKRTTLGVQAGKATPRGFRAGLTAGQGANRWLGKHPVAAGALGAGGMMLGNRMINGPSAAQGDVDKLQKGQEEIGGYLQQRDSPEARIREMYALMQMMQGRHGMGYGY